MNQDLLTICYLIGSITFIIGLKMLSNPASARKGNLLAAAGMTIAILGTIFLIQSNKTKNEIQKIKHQTNNINTKHQKHVLTQFNERNN